MELNYHAGTACRTLAQLVLTVHTGVQYFDHKSTDVITAVLLIAVCMNERLDLAKVDLDIQAASQYLHNFVSLKNDDITTLKLSIKAEEFHQSKTDSVNLYCFCLTAWIDGSTSKAIYGQTQKEYKAYQCSNCKDWFHKACLVKLDITLPKHNAEFICSRCTIPVTIQWNHKEFTNTCTSDNFLTILLLYCQQYPKFTSYLGNNEIENCLKASLSLMKKHRIDEGKSLILKLVHTRLNFTRADSGKLNCYGTEESAFLCLFSHVWKLQVQQQCTSTFCPVKNRVKTGYQTTFSLPKLSSNIQNIFPVSGNTMGYCGSGFSNKPPQKALYTLSDRIDASGTANKRDQFYACKGKSKVLSCEFISKTPWVIPICIEAIDLKQFNNLPLSVTVYNKHYQLGGCTINIGEHFVSVILWHGRPYYYDGLKSTNQQCSINYNPNMILNLQNWTGSYAYYFLNLYINCN